jgi:hypothetical protein
MGCEWVSEIANRCDLRGGGALVWAARCPVRVPTLSTASYVGNSVSQTVPVSRDG